MGLVGLNDYGGSFAIFLLFLATRGNCESYKSVAHWHATFIMMNSQQFIFFSFNLSESVITLFELVVWPDRITQSTCHELSPLFLGLPLMRWRTWFKGGCRWVVNAGLGVFSGQPVLCLRLKKFFDGECYDFRPLLNSCYKRHYHIIVISWKTPSSMGCDFQYRGR